MLKSSTKGPKEKQIPCIQGFDVPSWTGKPVAGLHLDVLKVDKVIQKLMCDEKKFYFFGRNPINCDFIIDHASCSRVHACLLYHKHLNRSFLVDLNSTHGTYIGHLRLEPLTPVQLRLDTQIHFGASTRIYILRERPQSMGDLDAGDMKGISLPENDAELDNVTEYNTAQNRRVALVTATDETGSARRLSRKRKLSDRIYFKEEDEVINPEDVDPSVGRFRNMVSVSVVPHKRPVYVQDMSQLDSPVIDLYHDVPMPEHPTVVNLAPDVEAQVDLPDQNVGVAGVETTLPKKRVYPKESWSGKKSQSHGSLLL